MMSTNSNVNQVLAENLRAARTWGAGGGAYERISRQIADAIEHAVDRLDPRPNETILDAATGTGWTARRVAARGASVTGIDIGAEVIEAATAIDRTKSIDFRVADAEALPFPDGYFDGAVSTFGVMFTGNPTRAARELARVVRPGGKLVLATWTSDGGVYEMFKVIKRYAQQAQANQPSPFAWGHTAYLVELFSGAFDFGFEQATSYYREPSGAAAWESFSTGYGPVVSLLATLDDDEAARFRTDFELHHERYRTGAGILVPREYVIAVGKRHL